MVRAVLLDLFLQCYFVCFDHALLLHENLQEVGRGVHALLPCPTEGMPYFGAEVGHGRRPCPTEGMPYFHALLWDSNFPLKVGRAIMPYF